MRWQWVGCGAGFREGTGSPRAASLPPSSWKGRGAPLPRARLHTTRLSIGAGATATTPPSPTPTPWPTPRRYEGYQPANMSNIRSPDEYKRALLDAKASGKLLVAKFFTEDCYVSADADGGVDQECAPGQAVPTRAFDRAIRPHPELTTPPGLRPPQSMYAGV